MICHCCNNKYKKYPNFDKVYLCSNCNHIYRDVNFDTDFYKSGDYRKGHQYMDSLKRTHWISNIISFFSELLINDDICSVFEVGTGDGRLLQTIKDKFNKKVSSCEIDENIKYEWNNLYEDFAKTNIDNVDLIVSTDVIEHFKEPIDFFSVANCNFLVLQVPVNRTITEPGSSTDTHYHYFSINSIEELASKSNFKLLKWKITSRGETANGPEMLSLFEKE